jgi:two-component system invasion response regulator UvrY
MAPGAPDVGSVRVLVADDQPDIADMLEYVIGDDPGLDCVGCLHSADELAAAVRNLHPDVLVLDARMPGVDPLTAIAELAPEFPGLKSIFYSGYDDPDFIERIIDAGAWGFVSKRHESDAVVRAIHNVVAGKVVFPERRRRIASPDTKPTTAIPPGTSTDGR